MKQANISLNGQVVHTLQAATKAEVDSLVEWYTGGKAGEYTIETIDLDKDPAWIEGQIQAARRKEYPTTDDLVVALWEKIFEGKDAEAQALQDKRLAVKAKYPKPK